MSDSLEVVEIYPKVLVYKNLFKDINKTYAVLKESAENNEDRALSTWTEWSVFGDYIRMAIKDFNSEPRHKDVANIKPKTQIQEDQKELLEELLTNFDLVTADYAKRYNIDVDPEAKVMDEHGNMIDKWKINGPSIARYHKEVGGKVAMYYHSDYIREPIVTPGYKFVFTALAYFNDDYEGGEIDFVIGKKLIKYKPVAGDWLVFPSGHPDFLTEDGEVYLHGVMPSSKAHKYFSRMYWMVYDNGSDEWFEKEREFGKEVWAEMQADIMEKFRQEYPPRDEIKDGVRIR